MAAPKFLSFAALPPGKDVQINTTVKEVSHSIPIVIDAGSYRFRAGYAIESSPSMTFEPMVHRYQVKSGEPARWAIGTNAPSGVSKTSSRTPFESPTSQIIVHPSSMEHILDHIFSGLKVTGESVKHDVVMTEPVGNPVYCRKEMSEMLFEGYGVPRVSYGIDALFGLANSGQADNNFTALVISIGNCATHILPVVDGALVAGGVKRINFGGAVASDYLLRLLQQKYPSFPARMTLDQSRTAFHSACAVAENYQEKIQSLPETLEKENFTLQFPFVPTDLEREAAKARDREALALKRKEQADKLREKARLKKEAKLEAKKQHLDGLVKLKASLVKTAKKPTPPKRVKKDDDEEEGEEDEIIEEEEEELDLEEKLFEHGYESMEELEAALEGARRDLKAFENKIAGIEEPKETPDYSLLEIPDEELDAAGIQEKRRQRLMKSGADARDRMRQAKEEAAAKEAEERELAEKRRLEDFEGWKLEMYSKRNTILEKIKSRQLKKEALSNRKSNASGARLRAVISLGTESADGSKKEPDAAAAEKDDNFGADDADWQIYRDIRSGPVDPLVGEDEDLDEALQNQLLSVEEELERWDDSFYLLLAEELSASRTILDRLREPVLPKPDDEAARHQLHLNVERYRVPEALFQPQAILGQDSAGLAESIQQVLSNLPPAIQAKLTANIFVTGGTAAMPGLQERLSAELESLRPAGEKVKISFADDLMTGAWKGTARLANSGNLPWITRSWYDEHGGERLPSTSWFTNPY